MMEHFIEIRAVDCAVGAAFDFINYSTKQIQKSGYRGQNETVLVSAPQFRR
jgi:hypothetical protein